MHGEIIAQKLLTLGSRFGLRRGSECFLNQRYTVRKAHPHDAKRIANLLRDWLGPAPSSSRADSIADAIENQEILVAVSSSGIIGFIHYVMHNDVIDGAPNAFITAFYVGPSNRHAGVGTSLLQGVIADARRKGVVSIETSTTHSEAKRFYEERGFRQSSGDIGESFLEFDI